MQRSWGFFHRHLPFPRLEPLFSGLLKAGLLTPQRGPSHSSHAVPPRVPRLEGHGSLPPACLLLLFHHGVPRMDQMLSFNLPDKRKLATDVGKMNSLPNLQPSQPRYRPNLGIGMGGGRLCFLRPKQQGAVNLIKNLSLPSGCPTPSGASTLRIVRFPCTSCICLP